MLVNREVILLELESTYNVDPSPVAGTNALMVENLSWAPANARMNARPAIRSSLGKLKQLFGGMLATVTFDAEIKGSGTAGVAPEIGAALQACAMSETIVANTSVTYKPTSSSIKSCTIYYYQDGKLYKFTGCRGNASMRLEAGKQGMVSFTFTGHFGTPVDEALVTPTYQTNEPPLVLSAGFTVDGYGAVISSLALDCGSQVATAPNVNNADGFGEVRVSGRDPNGSFDPEDVLIATNDFIADWRANTAMALTTGVIGTAGNRFQLSMPKISYRNAGQGDRDGIRTFEMSYGAAENAGDDEFSLAFT